MEDFFSLEDELPRALALVRAATLPAFPAFPGR